MAGLPEPGSKFTACTSASCDKLKKNEQKRVSRDVLRISGACGMGAGGSVG